MLSDFLKAFYAPDTVIEKIKSETKSVATFVGKLMLGAMFTLMTMGLAFFGIIILEVYFLFVGEISFEASMMFYPLYAIFIPLILWILDTVLLVIGIILVGGKPDIVGLLNLKAFSMAPIPLKILYVFYTTKSISLKTVIGLPSSIVSVIITLWSLLLLARGIKKFFEVDWERAFLAAIVALVIRIAIVFFL